MKDLIKKPWFPAAAMAVIIVVVVIGVLAYGGV